MRRLLVGPDVFILEPWLFSSDRGLGVLGCSWSKRLEAISRRMGVEPPHGLLEEICGLEDAVAYSIVELFDLVYRVCSANPEARGELGSSVESSLLELYRVTRGYYGVGLPESLHGAVNRLAQGDCSGEIIEALLASLSELIDMVKGLERRER